MGKLTVALTVGATGSVASVGGAYILGAFGNGNLDIPVSLEKFKEKDGWNIISNYFPNVLMGTGNKVNEGEAWDTNKPGDKFLGDDKTKSEGRLVVNWEKFNCPSNSASGKTWTGRIRWLWTLLNGDKGLVLYASAKSNDQTDSKLDAEGVIYALEKEQGEWKIKQNKQNTGTPAPKGEITDLDNNFPNLGDTFKTDLKVKEYWGFADTSQKLTDLCKSGTDFDWNQKPHKEFKGSWTWKHTSSNGKSPLDWSKSNHSWLSTFYSTMTPTLETLVTGFSGTWAEGYFVNKSLGVTEFQK